MKNAPLIILKATVGGLIPAALLLYIALAIGGKDVLRAGVDVLRCLPTEDPQACVKSSLGEMK